MSEWTQHNSTDHSIEIPTTRNRTIRVMHYEWEDGVFIEVKTANGMSAIGDGSSIITYLTHDVLDQLMVALVEAKLKNKDSFRG